MSLWQVLSLVALLQIGLFQQVLGGNVTCPQPGDCNHQCVYGFEPPTNPDCPSCSCINPCEGYDCGSFEVCRVKFRADIPPPTPEPLTPGAPGIGPNPEPPVATCYSKPECHPLADCSQKCPEGLYKDSGKVLCPNCSCIVDPCKAFDCGPSKDCVVRAMWPSGILAEFDIDGPSIVPVCVPRQSISSTQGPTTELTNTPGPNTCLQGPSMGDCDAVIPRWFFNVSALECQTFQYGGCGGNDNNFVSQSDCLARCLPTSINCPDVSCASPCQLQYNSKGCQICVCPGATCKDFQCPSNEECQIVNGQCSITAQVCHPRPQCLPKTDGTTVYTPPMCPYIECEGKECPYNFKLDQHGCKTCQCYDPCETYECPTGQVCAVMPPDCSQGEECRDAPVRYCTEPSPPPILRDRPSAEEMMSCCVAENVSARCQPLCIPDLSVQSDVIPVMLQCVGELKSYLKCAGGGASYTSCCKNKGLGSSCYEFCAGNVSIDTTNLHMFSDCLMNNYLNDVLLCYQTGMPDVKSTVATAVPTREVTSRMPTSSGDVTSRMSTARLNPADVCTQGMDTGSCEAAMTRWFFNTDTLQCESFMYGGCEGNANNFMTLEDCLAACLIEVPPQCPLVLCEEHCAYIIGADGCTKCVCQSSPSPSPGQSSSQDVSQLWRTTRYSPTKDPITPPMSLQQCCIDAGVESQCMPMCSFEFNFDVSSVPALLACQSHLATGLRCAKRDRTYTQCCSQSGVTGQCLESCGSSVNITDYTCLITEHAAMLSCFSNEQTDVECPTMAACDLICPYGNPKDSNGCRVCECLDPCQDVNCPEGKSCTYEQYPDCQGDICGLAYRGKCTDTIVQCPDLDALDCHNTCPYGRVKDNDECDTCNCSDPCKDVTCESGYTCKVNTTLDCAGLECMTRYLPTCSVECEQLECGACEFGNVKDVNNCNTCECFDPCKNVTCSEPLVCVPRIIPTLVEEDAVREEFIGECRLKPVCSDLSIGCRRYCEFGFLKNSSGCEICDCFEPCQNVTCTNGTECKPEAVQATKEHPYSAIGKCQAHSNCDITCAMYCEYGMEKDDKGCNLCRCYEPCAGIQCVEGKVCKSEPTTEADNSRYSFKGVCRDKCSPPACNEYCKYGLMRDNNGCEVCECSDPCKDKTCDHVSVCQPRRITESPPHSYIGECVRCSGRLCDIACDYGTVMLTAACPLCECFSPCQNITCRVGQKCEAKPVNITAAYLQMYTGECVDAVCPNVMCSNECQYGYKKTKEGCDTCECSYPCNDTKCLTGYVCEVKTETNCMSGNCSRIHYAACVPPPRPCARQQQLDITRYSPFDLDLAPLLNCDIDGYYKPLQCDLQDVCRCSTPEGLTKPKYDSLTLQQAIDLCYPDDRIDAKLRVHADYSILRMGNGTFFKQYVSKQLADALKVPDSNVTITKYREGSILVDFLVSSVHKHLMDNAWNTIMLLQQTNQMIPVEYNGQHYHGVLEFAERVGPYVTLSTTPEIPPTPRTSKQGGLTRAEFLVIVTVVPIVGGLLLMLIVAICVYKIYMYKRGHDELISDSVRSSMSFDNVMVEKGGRPKSGYENPSYNEVKVKPTSGTFSSNGDITTA